jgi:aminoglycoside phosphotransferase family enzyme/predicted kinase
MAGGQQDNQARLVQSLSRSPAIIRAGGSATIVETHISYVLLTGTFAYKIKKAVDLGFLDFSTLDARRLYCQHELRLNRRLAPAIYLDVVPITGSIDQPLLGGSGAPIEYAVKMREFPQEALLSQMLSRGALGASYIDELAAIVAAFHRSAAVASADGPFGVPADLLRLAQENFAQTRPLLADPDDLAHLDALQSWTEREYAARASAFEGRRAGGFIRECHGDLHLGNIALVDGKVTVFDCIEFNEEMRWIDVLNEAAFTVMDLLDRRRSDLAFRFLNAYLQEAGDYAGLPLLRFYVVYRAMVRAKVIAIRAAQMEPGLARTTLLQECRGYLDLASERIASAQSAVLVMHGLSGSGKTTGSQALVESLGAVRIRTDVERKRLHGLAADASSASPVGGGLYTPADTDRTYEAARLYARAAAAAGYLTIVDGAFLKRRQRDLFRHLAAELGVPFLIIACRANEATLRGRIDERLRRREDASEADLAVLEHQLSTVEQIGEDEAAFTVEWDVDRPRDQALAAVIAAVASRLKPPAIGAPS